MTFLLRMNGERMRVNILLVNHDSRLQTYNFERAVESKFR